MWCASRKGAAAQGGFELSALTMLRKQVGGGPACLQ